LDILYNIDKSKGYRVKAGIDKLLMKQVWRTVSQVDAVKQSDNGNCMEQ
jgi:hypothetical protein